MKVCLEEWHCFSSVVCDSGHSYCKYLKTTEIRTRCPENFFGIKYGIESGERRMEEDKTNFIKIELIKVKLPKEVYDKFLEYIINKRLMGK